MAREIWVVERKDGTPVFMCFDKLEAEVWKIVRASMGNFTVRAYRPENAEQGDLSNAE